MTRCFRKRACSIVLVNKVKNPIKLARDMLVRGEKDDPGGALGHCCLAGETVEKLAKDWGLEMVNESYFWTRKRWNEHKRGLQESKDDSDQAALGARDEGYALYNEHQEDREDKYHWPLSPENGSGWDDQAYLPQGTAGCVALDQYGAMCVATSTGGLTNKLSGRIGDTPTSKSAVPSGGGYG